jgi:DNA invertase Pin-like site-specific DNA recombinase
MTDRDTPTRVEEHGCPTCRVPAGSACRTASGNTAFRYHTARLLPVSALTEPEVLVPADRGPGTPWPQPQAPAHHRIGYAWGPDTRDAWGPDTRDQHSELAAHGCEQVFADHGPFLASRPERARALMAAAAEPGPATVTVVTLAELARNSAELADVAASLAEAGVRLEILAGPLAGLHDPHGSAELFTVLAAASMLDHAYARERNAAGRRAAEADGRRSGRPRVIDDDLLAQGRALRAEGLPVPQIAQRLVITTGKNAGEHPSLASVYRALAEAKGEVRDAVGAHSRDE